MVKIRVSYTTEQELSGVIRLLSPVLKSCKVSKNDKGHYKKAYIELSERCKRNVANVRPEK